MWFMGFMLRVIQLSTFDPLKDSRPMPEDKGREHSHPSSSDLAPLILETRVILTRKQAKRYVITVITIISNRKVHYTPNSQ